MKSEMGKVLEWQERVLEIVAGHMDDFYLVGGTALSREYFHHRESFDLDFFTKNYSLKRIDEVIDRIALSTRKKLKKSVDSKGGNDLLKMRRYELPLGQGEPLKIDFVADPVDLLKPFKRAQGIDYASLDDIYLRKIYASAGIIAFVDALGRVRTRGKRQEARDLFDLYHLSKTYKRLSVFIGEYPEKVEIHAVFQWYHSLNKAEMNFGLGDIVTDNPLEFTEISRHFRKEIEALMREVV